MQRHEAARLLEEVGLARRDRRRRRLLGARGQPRRAARLPRHAPDAPGAAMAALPGAACSPSAAERKRATPSRTTSEPCRSRSRARAPRASTPIGGAPTDREHGRVGRHLRALGGAPAEHETWRTAAMLCAAPIVRSCWRPYARLKRPESTKVGITMPSVYARSDMVAKSSRCTFACSASASATHAASAPRRVDLRGVGHSCAESDTTDRGGGSPPHSCTTSASRSGSSILCSRVGFARGLFILAHLRAMFAAAAVLGRAVARSPSTSMMTALWRSRGSRCSPRPSS